MFGSTNTVSVMTDSENRFCVENCNVASPRLVSLRLASPVDPNTDSRVKFALHFWQ